MSLELQKLKVEILRLKHIPQSELKQLAAFKKHLELLEETTNKNQSSNPDQEIKDYWSTYQPKQN